MSDMEFKDKFIGFVDILGFKEFVKAAETKKGMSLPVLLEILKDLGTPEDQEYFRKHCPGICPKSTYIQYNLNFRLTQFSDCVVVSSEVSPAGLINLVNHCWGAVMKLMTKGILCRGYITRGLVYHTDIQIIGSGYQNALAKEDQVMAFKREADERGTPFVEVDPAVCDYMRACGDTCVKEMFSRYIKEDGTVTALFPFQRLRHSFIIGDWFGHTFNPERERQSNKNMRSMIEKMKDRIMAHVDQSNPKAMSKAEHYIAALNKQVEECERTDKKIDMLNPFFPSGQKSKET